MRDGYNELTGKGSRTRDIWLRNATKIEENTMLRHDRDRFSSRAPRFESDETVVKELLSERR